MEKLKKTDSWRPPGQARRTLGLHALSLAWRTLHVLDLAWRTSLYLVRQTPHVRPSQPR
jgi:hypothetical protein